MTIREAWEKKKAAQAAAGQAAARSGETIAPNGRQSVGGIQVLLARIFAALAALGKKTAEKLRQKRKDNDGRSQTTKSVTILAGGSGGRLGLASEPEEQEETGGSRIALLVLLASLTTLALWAYDGYDGCYVGRDENCTESRTLCLPAITDESSPFWRPYDLELVWESTSTYSTCDTADPGELGYTECDPYEGTCQYEFRQIKHSPSSNCSNIIEFTSAVTETKNVTTGYAWGNCCPHPW